jgi:hypothetical protein
MVEEMKLRNFSPATQESYLYAVTRLTKHYRRSPDQLDKEQIRSYLLHLTVERKLSPNTILPSFEPSFGVKWSSGWLIFLH